MNRPVKIQRQTLIVMLIVLILEIVGVSIFYVKQKQNIAQLNKQLDASKAKLDADQKLKLQEKDLEATASDQLQNVGKLDPPVPNVSYLPTLLEELRKLASDNHVTLLQVKPNTMVAAGGGAAPAAGAAPPPPPANAPNSGAAAVGAAAQQATAGPAPPPPAANADAGFDKWTIDINIQGTYTDSMWFLYRLTTFPRVISVDRFAVDTAPSPTPDAPPNITLRMTVSAYIRKGATP